MDQQCQLLKLDTGHTIVTPKGEPITEEEYRTYFGIVCDWLKELNPKAYDRLALDRENGQVTNGTVAKMFDALLYKSGQRDGKGSCPPDERTLAFIFVVSYRIQLLKNWVMSPFLGHAMGNALLEWLPIPKLIEYYLVRSAVQGSNLRDAHTLTELYLPGISQQPSPFPKDAKKALAYARLAYRSGFNKHGVNLSDYLYARALFVSGEEHAEEAMRIVLEKLSLKDDQAERTFNLLHYLSLGLQISAKAEGLENKLDLDQAKSIIEREKDEYPDLAASCERWLEKNKQKRVKGC